MIVRLFLLFLIVSLGCVHRIQVNPLPNSQASTAIPRSLQLAVRLPALEGADHRPGIILLEWPHRDLQKAVLQYARHRGTFDSVSTDSAAELLLDLKTKLLLSSRQGRYHYRIRLHAEMSEAGQLLTTYLAEGAATGSVVRWVTASDRDPIEFALRQALDDLFAQIEADRSLYLGEGGKPHHEPTP